MPHTKPHVVILAGPNGAGKSTFAPLILKDTLAVNEFVNADVIAKGLSAFDPESMAIQAGRLMLNRLDELSNNQVNFAFETTLASLAYAKQIKAWQSQLGYTAHLIYLWIKEPGMSVKRVERRVKLGGHYVPKEVIFRRYETGLRHLFNLYMPIVDSWRLYDNSNPGGARLLAKRMSKDSDIQIFDERQWHELRRKYAEDK